MLIVFQNLDDFCKIIFYKIFSYFQIDITKNHTELNTYLKKIIVNELFIYKIKLNLALYLVITMRY